MKKLDKKRFMELFELFEHATEKKNFVHLVNYYSLTLSNKIIVEKDYETLNLMFI
jgi:hypothetical protein